MSFRAKSSEREEKAWVPGWIGTTMRPVFPSKKIEKDLKPKEFKPQIVNQQGVVYQYLYVICVMRIMWAVGYTARHLHQRIVEHKNSSIGKHFIKAHGDISLLKESHFKILRKCQGKFECLIYGMLFIKELHPNLNTKSD